MALALGFASGTASAPYFALPTSEEPVAQSWRFPVSTRILLLFLVTSVMAAPLAAQQQLASAQASEPLLLDFHSRHYQAPFSFEIYESAYVAVFRIKRNTARLVFPFLGPDLRYARFAGETLSVEAGNLFPPGRHVVPREVPGSWGAHSENKTLPHDDYLLLVASRDPLDFEGLNRILKVGRSLGFVEPDLSVALAQAIVPDPESEGWAAYLHWIR